MPVAVHIAWVLLYSVIELVRACHKVENFPVRHLKCKHCHMPMDFKGSHNVFQVGVLQPVKFMISCSFIKK